MRAQRREPQLWFLCICVAGVLGAAAIRIACATGDLWLDEVWTLDLIRQSDSLSEVLFFPHNNNHPLNSLFLYAVADQGESFWIYRLHSLVAGVGSVILAGLIGLRRGRLECGLAILLTGSSYLLIQYASEARGYSLMICFALAAFYALERFVDTRGWPSAAAFSICCVLGLLSHLFFVQFYMAAGLWSFAVIARRSPLREALRDTAIAHAAVFAFLAYLYFDFVLGVLHHGSAIPTGPLLASVIQAASLGLGGPDSGTTSVLVSVLALGSLGWGLWVLRGDAQQQWLFYALVCFGVPAGLLWYDTPPALFARYFLISLCFLLLLLSFALADLARRGPEGRRLVALALGLVLFGNAVNIAPLWRYCHGQYLAALHYMAENTWGRAITIGSNHGFRNRLLVNFYADFLPGKGVHYIEAGQGYPEWLIVHHAGALAGRGDEAVLYEGRQYELEEIFRTSDLAGFDWRLYRRRAARIED